MRNTFLSHFDPASVPSPCFVVDKAAVERNLQTLHDIEKRSGAKILAALKAFSFWKLGALTHQYLSGICASGIHEAQLGYEEYGGEIHIYSVAYKEQELKQALDIAHHVVFNSFSQWQRFQPLLKTAKQQRPELEFGLRVNPMHSEVEGMPFHDACAPGSRLGISLEEFQFDKLEGISGLHFHSLCEQDLPPLQRTLAAVEQQFGDVLHHMRWINFGGGHLITKEGYQIDELVNLIRDFSARYDVQVYLEPGEAIAFQSGVLVTEVLDIVHNAMPIAILDMSATCHMPDVLEMPYRVDILGAGMPDAKPHTYRLGGTTCQAGDVIGDYSFDKPLEIGQRLMIDDMAHYTMVKTNTFNGINLPTLALWDSRKQSLEIIKQFDYNDFKNGLS